MVRTLPLRVERIECRATGLGRMISTRDGQVGGAFRPSVSRSITTINVSVTNPRLRACTDVSAAARHPRQTRSLEIDNNRAVATGNDMSRSEYLEFYAADAPRGTELRQLALIFDIGTVSEDAILRGFPRSDNMAGIRMLRTPLGHWHARRRSESQRIVKSGDRAGSPDSRGLWNQSCTTTPIARYVFGTVVRIARAVTDSSNTEDLDGNGVLSANDAAHISVMS